MAFFMTLIVIAVVVVAINLIINSSKKTDYSIPENLNYTGYYKEETNYDTYYDEEYEAKLRYFEEKKIPTQFLKPKENILNAHNYFARKKIVITGDLDNFPERKDLAEILWNMGADIDTAISERINIVIVGESAGWEKLNSVEEIQKSGGIIETMNEEKMMQLINEQQDIDDADVSLMELAMQKIYLTGSFDYFIKPNLKLLIADRGGELMTQFSKKVTILLIGYHPDIEIISKARQWNRENKANITFSNEKEFLELIFPDQKFKIDDPLPEKPFEGQKIVLTGLFQQHSRNDLKTIITLLGGQNTSSISKKTNCVIVGNNPGPGKLEKIQELNSTGAEINVINEYDLNRIIRNASRKLN